MFFAKLLNAMRLTGAPCFMTFDPHRRMTSRLTSWQRFEGDASQIHEWNGQIQWDWRLWRRRIGDRQDDVCGNLLAAPPFRLTQFYISWQTNCLRDMFASQIVYDAFEPSFKEVAENTHSWVAKKKKNLGRRHAKLRIQLWPIWTGRV